MKYLTKEMEKSTNSFRKNIEECMFDNLGGKRRAITRFIYDKYQKRGEGLTLDELRRIVKENNSAFKDGRSRDRNTLNKLDDLYKTYVLFALEKLKNDSKKIYEAGSIEIKNLFLYNGKNDVEKEKYAIYRDESLLALDLIKKNPMDTYDNLIHDLPDKFKNQVKLILSSTSDSLAENLEKQEKLQKADQEIDNKRRIEAEKMSKMKKIKYAILVLLLSLVGWKLFGSSEDKDNHDTQDGEETKTEAITTEANDENTIKELER